MTISGVNEYNIIEGNGRRMSPCSIQLSNESSYQNLCKNTKDWPKEYKEKIFELEQCLSNIKKIQTPQLQKHINKKIENILKYFEEKSFIVTVLGPHRYEITLKEPETKDVPIVEKLTPFLDVPNISDTLFSDFNRLSTVEQEPFKRYYQHYSTISPDELLFNFANLKQQLSRLAESKEVSPEFSERAKDLLKLCPEEVQNQKPEVKKEQMRLKNNVLIF